MLVTLKVLGDKKSYYIKKGKDGKNLPWTAHGILVNSDSVFQDDHNFYIFCESVTFIQINRRISSF